MRVVEKTPEVIILEVGSRSSPGKTYYVTIDSDQEVRCTCKGFEFHEDCHHSRKIRELLILNDDRGGPGAVQTTLPTQQDPALPTAPGSRSASTDADGAAASPLECSGTPFMRLSLRYRESKKIECR